MQMITRRIWGAGAAYNLALGFIPDYVEIWKRNDTLTTAVLLKWWGELYEDDAAVIANSEQYGISATGVANAFVHAVVDENNGIQSYEGSKTPVVLVDSPIPGKGLVKKAIYGDWGAEIATASIIARTASTVGTIIRPTVHNGYVYECTTAMDTNTGTTEPTWGTTPGEATVDGDGSNGRWTCREENIVNAGELGITIGKTLAADSQILFVNAFKADSAKNLGDVA